MCFDLNDTGYKVQPRVAFVAFVVPPNSTLGGVNTSR